MLGKIFTEGTNYCYLFILVSLFVSCESQESVATETKNEPHVLTEDMRLLISEYETKALASSEAEQADSVMYWYAATGDLYTQAGQWDSLYQTSLRIFGIAYEQRDFEAAHSHFARYRQEVGIQSDTTTARLAELQAFMHYMAGEREDALVAYQEVADIMQKYPVSKELLNSQNMLGILYTMLGDYPLAETIYEASIPLSIEFQDTFLTRKFLANLGIAQISQGNWEPAIPNLEAAHALIPYEDGFYEHHLVKALVLGRQPQKALPLARAGLEKRLQFDRRPSIALSDAYHSLGEVYFALGNYQQAKQYYEQSLEKAMEEYPPGHRAIGKAYIFLGDACRNQGLLNLALQQYQQAVQVFLPAFEPVDLASCPASDRLLSREVYLMEALRNKGKTFLQLYEQDGSMPQLEAAATHFQTAVEFINQIRLYYTEEGAKAYVGDYAIPFIEDAIQSQLLLLEKTEEARYQEKAFQLAQQANAFLLRETVNEDRALQIAQVLPDSIAQLKAMNISISETQVASGAATSTAEKDSLMSLLVELKRERLRLLEKVERDYPKYFQLKHELAPIVSTSLQRELDDNTLVVKYFFGEENLYTFAFSKERMHSFSVALDSSFYQHIGQYRKTLSDLDYLREEPVLAEQQFLESSSALYQQLLQPSLQAFAEESVSDLVIIPDGILNYLSFECMLVDPADSWLETDAFLMSRYALRYAYYAGLLLDEEEEDREQSRFAGLGTAYDDATLKALKLLEQDSIKNPQFKSSFRGAGLSNLPYADDEVDEVAELLSGKAFLNEAATKANFLQHIPNYDAIHIATHSFIDSENDSIAYIAFNQDPSGDYLLSLQEIYGLDLEAEMITLSSCQSSFGPLQRSEGIMSLARAFKFAGSKSLVASQWSISDRSSYLIMKAFYQNLRKGLSKSQALQKAKLSYLNDDQLSSPAYRIPAYWGALIVVGDEQPMVFEAAGVTWWYWLVGLLVLGVGAYLIGRKSASKA